MKYIQKTQKRVKMAIAVLYDFFWKRIWFWLCVCVFIMCIFYV